MTAPPLDTYFRISLAFILAGVLLIANMGWGAAAGSEQTLQSIGNVPVDKALLLGERMYREGVLPSGKAMRVNLKDEVPADSSAFACVSCHMRAGFGSTEGGVVTPPATGSKLFDPAYKGTLFTQPARGVRNQYVVTPKRRQAYNDETLARALREGINPDGRKLDDVMPRYQLSDNDMAIMVHYLKSLSARVSPGVDSESLRLATIVTDGVSTEDRQAMLGPLEEFVSIRNSQSKLYNTRTKYMGRGGFADPSDLAYRKLSLAVWELKGAPESWRSQLDAYYRREPVFALLGGISSGSWQPIHQFCEDEKLPCLFPITDFPVVSDKDWYTFYFNKGFRQEGEAAARFIGRDEGLSPEIKVVQIVRDSNEGRELAAGFDATWSELERIPAVTITLKRDEELAPGRLQQITEKHKPAVLLLWTGKEALPALEGLAAAADRPKMVIASSGYLKNNLRLLSDRAREMTWFTYPYRLEQDEQKLKSTALLQITTPQYRNNEKRIATRTYSLLQVLQLGLLMMERNIYRDNFLDVISMIPDQILPDYERLSFAPGQRYPSRGCYIVQLTPGSNPELVKKSDWLVH